MLPMKSPEKPEDQYSLLNLREQVDTRVGKPYPNETRILVWHYKHPLEKTIFDPLFSDKNRLKTHLIRLKTELYPSNPYSSPLVCASQVNYAKEAIMAEAKLAAVFANQENRFKFAVLFDIAHGMDLVVKSVVAAQDILRNPSDPILSSVVEDFAERYDLNPVEDVEVFLRVKQLVSHFAELLKKDNSGFLLIKEVVKSLKDYKSSRKRGLNIPISDNQIPELVVAGAELGAKLYKKLYPFISQTTPPKSS